MSADDWAVVAGVRHYPALGDLDGPENDAKAFHRWLLERAKLPPHQAKRVLSSDFAPPAASVLEAKPTCERIEEKFDELCAIAEQRSEEGKGLKVGRRLYIFLAGHGFTPCGDDAALLMANATRNRTHHVPGRPYANWFLRAGYFDEVVLFMDCCRERYPQAPLRVPPYIDLTDPGAVDRSKLLYGFATKWSRLSREKPMEGGEVHGIFTATLLAGLNGAAGDEHGEITARSIADYLYNHMKQLLTPEELEDEDVPKDPELLYDTDPNARFVLLEAEPGGPPRFPVCVHLRAEDVGKDVEVLDSRFARAAQVKAQAPECALQLPRGMYLCQVAAAGRQRPFEVSGLGVAHVQL